MNLVNDDALAGALRRSVDGIDLLGAGPDLAEIRRRGSGRRRRHRTAAAAAGLAVAVAAAGTVAVDRAPSDSLTGYAGRPEQPPEDTDAAQVTRAIDGALDRAGIAGYDSRLAAPVQEGGAGPDTAWGRFWAADTDPATVVYITVRPDGGKPDRLYPCQMPRYEFRSCTDEVDGDGVRVVSGMSLSTASAVGREMWTPTALAVYPDGRQVEISAELVSNSRVPRPTGDRAPRPTGVVVVDYPGPLTLGQMREFVADPVLADVPPPAG